MTAQHFTEFSGTIKKTYGLTDEGLCSIFEVSRHTIRRWRKEGVPKRRAIRFISEIRRYLKR